MSMLNKIILGTANFVQPYGVLAKGSMLTAGDVLAILEVAVEKGLKTLDTALGYGDISDVLPPKFLNQFQIITKFSVLETPEEVFKKLKCLGAENSIYGILIHDPQNLPLADIKSLQKLFESFRKEYGVQKIGVSIYDMNDLENFKNIYTPDLIQIPLNPFNQMFNNEYFKEYTGKNKIEIHARSLFLQGVLLADKLPKHLEPLKAPLSELQNFFAGYPSCLHGLMTWALGQDWVTSWVLGVSCLADFTDILKVAQSVQLTKMPEFQPINHPLTDPRNWSIL